MYFVYRMVCAITTAKRSPRGVLLARVDHELHGRAASGQRPADAASASSMARRRRPAMTIT